MTHTQSAQPQSAAQVSRASDGIVLRLLRPTPFFPALKRVALSLQAAGGQVEISLAKIASLTGVTASLYYLFKPSFRREHRAVLLGRIAYHSNLKRGNSTSALLRRNIHRLEKGLIMPSRRSVFALDYIGETLNLYKIQLDYAAKRMESSSELCWSFDILSSYFAATSGPEVARFRKVFQALPQPAAADADWRESDRRVPFAAGDRAAADVTFDQIMGLAQRRRSVRWFSSKPVERSKIDQLIGMASLAPSACNRMPYRFVVLDDPELAHYAAGLAGGTGGFAKQIPTLVVLLGDLGSYFSERDRHLIYIDASLAAMSFMLGAETLGLSSCPINWSDVPSREKKMQKFLRGIPEHMRPIMLIGLGYQDPACQIPFSSRKPLDGVRQYNL